MARRIIDTDYKAVDGTGWSVEVWDLYSSAPNRDLKVEMMSPGFNLTWNGDENNVLQPLLGSACSLTLALTETHRGILMPLIYSEEEFRLALLLRKENQVYWVGQIHTEECVELITDGYITVDITASDGIAQLENIDFKDVNGDPYSGRLPVIAWIHRILLKVPSIGLWFSQYQVGSVFAYEHHLNTPVLDGDSYQFNYTGDDNVVRGVLDYIYVSPSCWYLKPPEKDKVGDEFKRYPTTAKDGFVSCKMVLSDIMAAIGATICFSDGAWRIFDRTYLFSESASLNSSNVIQYTATENGTLEAGIFQEQIDVDVDASTSEFFRGAVRKGLHPFAGSTQVHKNAGADLVYASGVNYSIPPNKPIYKFVTGYGMEWASSALVRPIITLDPDQSNLFPYRDDPTISDVTYYMPDSGIFSFSGLTPIGSPSVGELQLPNGQGGGQIRINIAARALYKIPGEVGDTLGNNYVCRPGAMALLSFRFSVTDSNGVKYYLKRRVRTLNRYTNGQAVEVNLTGPQTIINLGDPDYGEDFHYKPKYYESDYYTWVATTDDYSNLAWVDIMLGGDPSVLESGVSDEFLTAEFPGSAQYTPPLTRINPSSSTDGELVTDFDDSKRNFEIRFDHAIFLPDNSGTIESCELESMWIEEHDANGGPAAMRDASGNLYATPTTYVKTPSYRTEKTPTGNDGIFNTTYFNHPRSLSQFELREIEIHAGDGQSNYDSVNTFIPTTVYGNETYSSPHVFAGGGSLDLSGSQYPVGRYAAKSYSQTSSTDPSLYFKMSTQWDSSDLADRMTHRVNKNVMQIRHRVRELVEATLFSSTSNGVTLEPWQRLITKKFQGTVIETFVPFRLSLEFSQAEQRLTLLKCRSESATVPGEADDKDIPRGNRPSGGTSNPIGPVHFLSSKVLQNEDDIISIYSKTNLITVTQSVDLDNVSAGGDTTDVELFHFFLEK
jgi:hypothetical protein